MDPDASVPAAEPSVFNYVLSFLLVGVAWGFTTPFIRRAAADFNARQEAAQKSQAPQTQAQSAQSATEEQELQESHPPTSTAKNGDEGEDEEEEESGEEDQPLTSNARSTTAAAAAAAGGDSTRVPAWMKPKPTSSWLTTKIVTVFWTVVNLLRTPAYSIPLVINLTGSIWFFLLVGKHELSLTVPLANSSAFLFTVLGEWYVERKVIAKETWLGMALVLGGIGLWIVSYRINLQTALEMPEEKCPEAEDSWSIDEQRRDIDVMVKLRYARQRPYQDPRDFDIYLNKLERRFPQRGEKERALVFFVKLAPELRLKIQLHYIDLPDTRAQMVTVATYYHSLLHMRESRREREESRNRYSKRTRRNADSHMKNRRSRNRNRPVKHGHPLKCYNCGSEEHLADRCI
ncbi:hypothetical protein CNMCM6106_003290 [Aspergillus hiratsukae]|uniref:CCHC-type domain-containing protein n=1 Tax=Aspergillus hiratsukae TaxID=1194566 RepID=A0A8H6Q6A3_9EURO|nr:hypothetical protein CNMCM6106_003290 [Aspergillus hiratsukae]